MIVNNKEQIVVINGKEFHCAMDVTMNYIGGKWKTVVLWYLMEGKKRFSELRKQIPNITEKMLSLQLKNLESDGIVGRKVYSEIPPRVEYYLTDFGKSLIPILEEIALWGRTHAKAKGKMVEVKKKKIQKA